MSTPTRRPTDLAGSGRMAPTRRRARQTATAVATLVAMLAGLLVTVVGPPTAAEAADISEGYVDWGFKESWRTYVGEQGTTLTDGATWSPEGVYRFPIREGSFDDDTKTTVLELDGTAHFSKHDDLLNMTVRDLRVVISPDEQLIWGSISSRELTGDREIVDHGMTPIAVLDVPAVDPDLADETTTWTAIPASLTPEAAPVFIGYYPAGQVLDPVTIVYDGPGGKPEAEVITPPGTPAVEQVASVSQGFNVSPASTDNQISGLFYDPGNDLIHLVNRRGNFLRAADADTLEPVGTPSPRQRPAATPEPAFDAETGQIFALSAPTNQPSAVALTASMWDPQAQTYVTEVIDATLDDFTFTSTLAWDGIGERVVALARRVEGDETVAFIVSWERGGDGWTRVDHTLPPVPDGEGWSWYGPAAGVGLGAAPDGTFILARSTGGFVADSGVSAPSLRLTLDGGAVRLEELAGTQVPDGSAFPMGFGNRVTTGSDGTIVLIQTRDPNKLMVLGPQDGTYAPLAELQTEGIGRLMSSAVDTSDGTVFVADTQAGNLLVVRDGEVVAREPVAGLLANALVVSASGVPGGTVVVDEGVVVTTTFHDGVAHLTKLRVSGASPAIESHPADAIVTIDGTSSETVEFHASASGDPIPDLQWQVRQGGAGVWRDIDGATTEALAVEAIGADNANQYRLRATNAAGRNASDSATLSVQVTPSVVAQPEPVTVEEGENVDLLVMPAGIPTPDVTWQRLVGGEWTDLTSDTPGYEIDGGYLTVLASTQADSGAQFRARLTNAVGTVHSEPVTLTVEVIGEPAAIVSHPQSMTVGRGDTAVLNLAVSGAPWPTVDWERSDDGGATWQPAEGEVRVTTNGRAQLHELSLVDVSDADAARFRARVTNGQGDPATLISDIATLTVVFEAPEVTRQPSDGVAFEGQDVRLRGGGTGLPAPSFQWESSTDGESWSDWSVDSDDDRVAGRAAALELPDVGSSLDGRWFRLRVYNGAGEAYSDPARLTVREPSSGEMEVAVLTDGDIDPDEEAEIHVAGTGFGSPGDNGIRLAVTDTSRWQPGDTSSCSRRAVVDVYLDVEDGGFRWDVTIPAGELDPTKEYGVATCSSDADDRSWDTWTPLMLAGDEPGDGEQTINVTVPERGEGELVWSIDGDGQVDLGETTNEGTFLRANGALDPIVVSDIRDGGPEWSISGQVSDFSGDLPGRYLGWTPDVLNAGAGATAGDPVPSGFDSGDGLSDSSVLANADAGHDKGTATVGADLELRLPVDTPADTYTATLTITALT